MLGGVGCWQTVGQGVVFMGGRVKALLVDGSVRRLLVDWNTGLVVWGWFCTIKFFL